MILYCVIILMIILFLNAGNLLVSAEKPKKSDVIIVLSGYDGRLEKGIELFKKDFGDYLLLSKSQYFNEDTLIQSGIQKEKIIFEKHAVSTYTNATLTKNILVKRKFDSAIVLTSEFHTRRSKYIFNKVFKDTKIELTFVSSKNGFFHSRYWWNNKKSIYLVCTEYIKWLRYLLYW